MAKKHWTAPDPFGTGEEIPPAVAAPVTPDASPAFERVAYNGRNVTCRMTCARCGAVNDVSGSDQVVTCPQCGGRQPVGG